MSIFFVKIIMGVVKMEITIGEIGSYNEESKKVRVISVIDKKILVCIYNGYYMLPGGKINSNEVDKEALIREIKEETGYHLHHIEKYLTTITYARNYHSRKYNKAINKKITTTYFLTEERVTLTDETTLSNDEKKGSFIIKYIDINDLINELEKQDFNEKQKVYAKELLAFLRYYLKKDELIDLHTHTNASDGDYAVDELIKKAKQNNIKHLAITDHDTLMALNKINYQDEDIQIIPGIEITVKRDKGRMHILGLDIDYQNEELVLFLKNIKEYNHHNLRNMIKYIEEKLNESFAQKDIENIFQKETNIGRPDIARLLIKEGYVNSVNEAFDKYLIEAFNNTRKDNLGYTFKDVLNIIKKANGISVLAHPNSLQLTKPEFESLISEMKTSGLDGIEVIHPNMTQEEREYFGDIAKKYDLVISGGSDFHGEKTKPDIKLATGRDNIYINSLPVLDLINTRRK